MHDEKDFQAASPTGILLTKYYAGGYKPAYAPFTHLMVAAKSSDGIVLVATDDGALWTLPGGAREHHLDCREQAVVKLRHDAGLEASRAAVLGYYRIVSSDRVEYGALVFCVAAADPKALPSPPACEWRIWDGKDCLMGLDPISEALASVAWGSKPWQDDV